MSTEHAIDLAAVRVALPASRTQQRRWAAYSAHPISGSDCHWPKPGWQGQRVCLPSPMYRGTVLSAIERTRREEGTRAIRRIFGVGIQALRAELAPVRPT